ncbi:ABC transporter permease [Naasia lichenicola]|uniref:ABC transporter permease n=1 Tax=Naasia lichenicola TaxID=2565933 RepID=UPI001E368B97|nr:ABC transporter permease [Naasia lichenicola]
MTASPSIASPRGRTLTDFLERYVVVLAVAALIVLFSVARPATFFTVGNLQTILTTQSVLLIIGLGLTVVLAAGDLDLSIAGVVSFCGVLFTQLSAPERLGWQIAAIVTLIAGVLIGLVNSLFIVRVKANALIVTLAMGTLLDGLSSAVSNSQSLALPASPLDAAISARFFGVGLPFWFTILLLVIVWYVLQHTPSGRSLYFTGEGREAARLVGVRVTRVRVTALVISALAAAIAGIVLVGQSGAAQAGLGNPFLLPAYASVFLGAATLTPGRFNPVGTVVGALLLAVGTTGLQLLGIASWVTNVFSGGILIVAVAAAALLGARRIRA